MTGVAPTGVGVDPDLLDAIVRYDHALLADDLDGVDALFDDDPETSRFDERGPVRGPGAISAMRRRIPSGVDGRRDVDHRVRMVGPGAAVATLEFTRGDGSAGLRTQVWRLTGAGWRITHAHLGSISLG